MQLNATFVLNEIGGVRIMGSEKSLGASVEALFADGVTFAQAMQRLEFLGRELDRGSIELEALEATIHEMDVLLRFCAQKIGVVRTSVDDVISGWKPLLSTLNEQD